MTDRKRFAVLNGGIRVNKPAAADSRKCFEVLTGGLETTVQDYWGREGYLRFGVPRSGPMDKLSFQLGNQLVGNDENAAGIEIQFIGPKLRFFNETVIAITGANNRPKLNQKSIPLWQTAVIQPGDILSFSHAEFGARSYITFAGGIDTPLVMGSRSTFTRAQLGGFQGRKLMQGDVVYTFIPSQPMYQLLDRIVPNESRPEFSRLWQVEVNLGPHDDGLTPDDIQQFFTYDWIVSSKSDRIGYRLEGPKFQFSESARYQSAENGRHPSNTIDYGCSIGSVLLCGHTPTVLLADCPSLTGYIAPFTVTEQSLRKVGQARPGDIINFKQVIQSSASNHRNRLHLDKSVSRLLC
ncbi:MAG: biotin-dependent carboxyltransferase family protein [Leptolyngbyaceae cyanobacterium MO_188.B28]|nr:biotin-dependent carboxyltransferase family protein [Leptolyngbyaceae cyanobacterium MO_188.B28]